METKQITKEETTYLSCAETAKLVRKALKENFPSQKFSVRSSTYSMGASIDVSWDNGIPQEEVNKICKEFEGAGFDGMVDYKFYKQHWMMPDGSVTAAFSEGGQCTGGVVSGYDNKKPHPDAKKVSFGADYVFANRDVSEDIKESTARQIAKLNDLEFEDMGEYPKDKFFGSMGNNWWNIASQFLAKINIDTMGKIVRSEETCSGDWTDFYDVLPSRGDN